MIEPTLLRDLASRSAPKQVFLSIYLDPRSRIAPRELKARLSELGRSFLEKDEEGLAFQENREAIEKAFKGRAPSPGRAAFAGPGLLQVVDMPVAFETQAVVDSSPFIRPLVRATDEFETFALVVMDFKQARILLVTGERADDEDSWRGKVPARTKKGGWSQKRYARRRENAIQQYAKRIAADVAEIVRTEGIRRIVLSGRKQAIDALQRELPKSTADSVVGFVRWDLDAPDGKLLAKALPHFIAAERLEEGELVEEWLSELHRGGLALAVPDQILLALYQGKVECLIVGKGTRIEGRRCEACTTLAVGAGGPCGACGGATHPVALVDDMIQLAQVTGADTEFVAEEPHLTQLGGLGALLRYR